MILLQNTPTGTIHVHSIVDTKAPGGGSDLLITPDCAPLRATLQHFRLPGPLDVSSPAQPAAIPDAHGSLDCRLPR